MLKMLITDRSLGLGPITEGKTRAAEKPDRSKVIITPPPPPKALKEINLVLMYRCPFCLKHRNLAMTSNGHEQHAVICDDCGAEGPVGKTEREAKRKWNNR